MTITYKACKSLIERGAYATKEEMRIKLDVFHAGNRIKKDEYEELTTLLNNK